MISRRNLLTHTSALVGAAAFQGLLPAWARSGAANNVAGLTALAGTEFDLTTARSRVMIDGRAGRAVTINGQLPAPLLRWKEGDDITLRVRNELDEDTSIHWHGILLPPEMDGVPGVSFAGIKPGETFTYRFPLKQAGTYWYHSHSGFQEQLGHYGPIIVEPKGGERHAYDREYVVVLSDWTFKNPARIFSKLKKNAEVFNFQKRTLADFFRDAREDGIDDALSDRAMWGAMRMNATDIADVTAAAYTYLVNGHGPEDNWTGLFNPGERVRLRFINTSAMTIFNVRIPGLPMTVIQADGLEVAPVETDEFQFGSAETYDVLIEPQDRAYTLVAESIDRSGMARATLAPREGMTAPVPPLRERPILTMRDMAMAGHGGHAASANAEENHGAMAMDDDPHAMHRAAADPHAVHKAPASMDAHAAHGDSATIAHDHPGGVGVAGVAEIPANRLGEPGLGLENVAHRVLTYKDLQAAEMNPDMRAPEREMEIHLTGNMHRYMWSFDGKKFSEVDAPIVFHEGERLRMTLVNDTMMSHPIHLHGMFFDVVTDEASHFKPRKHTILVKPGEKLSVDITADAVGDWAFHCHLAYHMVAGMMQVVSVRPSIADAGADPHKSHDDLGGHKMHEDHGEAS